MNSQETACVHSLLIFPLAQEWQQVLSVHGCTFSMHEDYGEMIHFPEGTTRTLLYGRDGLPTNHYRIVLSDMLELREVLDDENKGKSWLSLVLSASPMEDTHARQCDQEDATVGQVTEEAKRHAKQHAYALAAYSIRQTICRELLKQRSLSRMLVIYELLTIVGDLEKTAQQIRGAFQEASYG